MSKLLSLQRHLVHLPKYLSLTAKVRLASSKSGNDYNYNDVVKNFEWKVPEKWNFAQDVIDKWAETNPGNLAFFHVGKDNSTNTQWSYQVTRMIQNASRNHCHYFYCLNVCLF